MPFYYWLIAIPVLAVLILVHEIGHFYAARLMKVRIEEFGIGFPPRLLTLGTRNGVRYTLNWLPFGGFTKMAGEEDPSIPDSLASKKPWQRLVVLAGGSLMNLVLAFAIFTGLALYGREEVAGPVGISYVEAGSPAALAGLQPGDFFVKVNDYKAASSNDVRMEVTLHQGDAVTLVMERDGQTYTTTVRPRKDPPPGQGAMGIRMRNYESPLTVRYLAEDAILAQYGLRLGDTITAVDGRPISDTLRLDAYLLQRQMHASLAGLVADLVQKGPASVESFLHPQMTLAAQRAGTPLSEITLRDQDAFDWTMEVSFARTTWRRYGIAEGWRQTWDATWLVPRTLAALFRGSVPVSSLAGPVGIFQVTGLAAQYGGLPDLLYIMALISVNLFVVNLLPIPALDGGRIVFVLLEWIRRGRRIPPRWEATVHMVFFFLLILLIAYLTYSDIARATAEMGGGIEYVLRRFAGG